MVREPTVVPAAEESVATSPEAGAAETGPTAEDSLSMTPEAAIKIPLMTGTEEDMSVAVFTRPTPCSPESLKKVEPADSDMKQPKK
jgi:hypothetical protein